MPTFDKRVGWINEPLGLMAYERDNIRRLVAYTPGEQPLPGQQSLVKLNTNENPYPPAKEILQAIHHVEAESLRCYPPPTAALLRKAVAGAHGVSADQVIITNGGDELLRLAVTVFCLPRREDPPDSTIGGVGVAEPSYSLYPVLTGIHDTPMVRLPLKEGYELPDDFAQRLNEAGCRLALLVNPHAPSGRLEPFETLERVAQQFKGVLLIDEAYVDFAAQDAISLLSPQNGLDNVLLLRTLSKGYSLAGLRIGYGLGHPGLIAALDKARDSYNVDVIAQSAAIAALKHRDQAEKSWRAVIQERDRLSRELVGRGWRVFPSQTNFLLVMPDRDACSVYESLKAKGVLVRYFDQDALRDKLRITVGTPQETDALLAGIDRLTTRRA